MRGKVLESKHLEHTVGCYSSAFINTDGLAPSRPPELGIPHTLSLVTSHHCPDTRQ